MVQCISTKILRVVVPLRESKPSPYYWANNGRRETPAGYLTFPNNTMAKGDVSTVGIDGGNQPFRVAASATRFFAGEPLNSLAALTTGAADVNTVVVLTDTKPRIATDNFVGIASVNAEVNASSVVIAHKTYASVPIPYITRVRARAKSTTAVDTDAELLAILWDAIDFDLTTAVYTFDSASASNASAFVVRDGNPAKSTLDCVIDARGMRLTIS